MVFLKERLRAEVCLFMGKIEACLLLVCPPILGKQQQPVRLPHRRLSFFLHPHLILCKQHNFGGGMLL